MSESQLTLFRHFEPYVKKQLPRIVPSFLLGLGYVIMGILEPWPMKMVFDYVLIEHPLPPWLIAVFGDDPGKMLLLNCFVTSIISIALVRGIFYYYQQLLSARAGQQIVSQIRFDLYAHLHRLSLSFHHRQKVGDLLTHLTGDIRNLREMLVSLPTVLTQEILLMCGMAIVMVFVDWQLACLAFLAIPLMGSLLKSYRGPFKNEIEEQRQSEGELASVASEVLGAVKVVQGYHQEEGEFQRIRRHDRESLESGLGSSQLVAKFRWSTDVIVTLITAVILGVAGKRVLDGALSPGDVIVFTYYLRAFNNPLKKISRVSQKLTKGLTSAERIAKMMAVEPEIQDYPHAVKAKKFQGEVVFNHVSFMYNRGEPILDDIHLKIHPGEQVALVGPTGSGKSTLVSLIPRFYDPTSGQVLIDGNDVRSYTLSSLRQQISFVFQEPILFSTTIEENIAYGRQGVDRRAVIEAAEKVNIHSMIESLPDRYDTVIGERGCTLSGGQRQCIAIARAIIREGPIVILDEPTNGLDAFSVKLVLAALEVLLDKKTVILISHLKEPIRSVDCIIKLKTHEKIQTTAHLHAR